MTDDAASHVTRNSSFVTYHRTLSLIMWHLLHGTCHVAIMSAWNNIHNMTQFRNINTKNLENEVILTWISKWLEVRTSDSWVTIQKCLSFWSYINGIQSDKKWVQSEGKMIRNQNNCDSQTTIQRCLSFWSYTNQIQKWYKVASMWSNDVQNDSKLIQSENIIIQGCLSFWSYTNQIQSDKKWLEPEVGRIWFSKWFEVKASDLWLE